MVLSHLWYLLLLLLGKRNLCLLVPFNNPRIYFGWLFCGWNLCLTSGTQMLYPGSGKHHCSTCSCFILFNEDIMMIDPSHQKKKSSSTDLYQEKAVIWLKYFYKRLKLYKTIKQTTINPGFINFINSLPEIVHLQSSSLKYFYFNPLPLVDLIWDICRRQFTF